MIAFFDNNAIESEADQILDGLNNLVKNNLKGKYDL